MANLHTLEIGIAKDVKQAIAYSRDVVQKSLDEHTGKIWIIPSVNFHNSTGTPDLDILLIGHLKNYYADYLDGHRNIRTQSFCTTIEIKSHPADRIYQDDTSLWVKYSDEDKNVFEQSEKQQETLKRFLKQNQHYPRITFIANAILLTGTTYDDYRKTIGLCDSNILASDYCLTDLFDIIGRQFNIRNNAYVNSFMNYSPNDIEFVAKLFCAKSNGAGSISLRSINLLHNNDEILRNSKNIVVLSGHAEIGKTALLLKAADKLICSGKTCLFLTIHSFLMSVLGRLGFRINYDNFEIIFREAISNLYKNKETYTLNYNTWDYVFIDEAQDRESPIPEILEYIFQRSHIVTADGIDQFMKSSVSANWKSSAISELKQCMRQRRDLTFSLIHTYREHSIHLLDGTNRELRDNI